tara:strand:- start:1 stop:588 length:588 start_codon:yes stop_codon:yes gene_type:complete
MATVNLNPNATVSNAWTVWQSGGGGTAHGVLSDSATSAIRTQDQGDVCTVELDDYSAGGTISSIRYCVSGFLYNTRGGSTEIQIKLLNSSGSVLYTENETLNFNSYNPQDHYGTARTTSDGSSAWTDSDLDGLRLSINTSPADPPSVSYANVVKAWVEVTYTPAGYGHAVNGIAATSISKVNGIATASISKVNGI